MDYRAYRAQTDRAAEATNGTVTSLAGGYYGVTYLDRGRHVVLALDLDGIAPTWLAWTEDDLGERCCDVNAVDLGLVRPIDFPELRERALLALALHTCYREGA